MHLPWSDAQDTALGCRGESLSTVQSQGRESGLSKATRKQVLKIRALTRLGRPVNPNLLWRKTEYFIFATSPNRQKKATKLES